MFKFHQIQSNTIYFSYHHLCISMFIKKPRFSFVLFLFRLLFPHCLAQSKESLHIIGMAHILKMYRDVLEAQELSPQIYKQYSAYRLDLIIMGPNEELLLPLPVAGHYRSLFHFLHLSIGSALLSHIHFLSGAFAFFPSVCFGYIFVLEI